MAINTKDAQTDAQTDAQADAQTRDGRDLQRFIEKGRARRTLDDRTADQIVGYDDNGLAEIREGSSPGWSQRRRPRQLFAGLHDRPAPAVHRR